MSRFLAAFVRALEELARRLAPKPRDFDSELRRAIEHGQAVKISIDSLHHPR